jgi:flagellar motility protein MotE (MotC chaperone)
MVQFRLFQIVIFAACCLLFLKASALLFTDLSILTGAQNLNAQEVQNKAADDAEKEAKRDEQGDEKKAAKKDAAGPQPPADEVKVTNDETQKSERDPENVRPTNYNEYKVVPSGSELDLLESLAVRRKQLNDREAQLKLRENLLTAAQQQIDERIEKLKELEAKIQVDLKKQDELRKNQYQRLVKMYSAMKPKEAARIFDGLDLPILVDIIRAMKAANGSQIVAKMNADKARAVTMMLAKKEQLKPVKAEASITELPEVVGVKPAADNQ